MLIYMSMFYIIYKVRGRIFEKLLTNKFSGLLWKDPFLNIAHLDFMLIHIKMLSHN